MEYLDHLTDDALERAEEEILTHTVSDEALEAAAGAQRGRDSMLGSVLPFCEVC